MPYADIAPAPEARPMSMIRRLTIAVSCLLLSSTSVQAKTTDWAVVDGDVRTYTRTILLPNGATDIQFPLNAPEPGYVLLGSGGKKQASVTWFDQTNAWLGKGDSRFGLADGIYGTLTRHVGVTGDLNLSLTYWPEMDLTEPNSEWYLAWPINLHETGQITLFPKGDVDAFKFTLEQQANVRISFANRAIRPRVRYHSAQNGKLIVDNPRAALPAGDYVVRISAPDMPPELLGQSQSFVLFREQGADARVNSLTGGEFRPGVPWNLGPFTDGHDTLEFTLEEPALLDITVSNRGNSVEALFENAEGLTRPVPSHLPPGAYKLILRNQNDNGFPGYVTLHRREITEAIEPNDFVTDATPLGATLTQNFLLEHESPIDWFSFEPRVAGNHFVRVSSIGKDRCGDLWSGFAPSGNNDQRYDRTGAGDGDVQVFGPIPVSEEEIDQTRSFYIACEALIRDTTHSVAVIAPGSGAASEASAAGSGSVYIVGIELVDGFKNELSALAVEANNLTFLLAEEAEDLSERIEDIVEAEEAIEDIVEAEEAIEDIVEAEEVIEDIVEAEEAIEDIVEAEAIGIFLRGLANEIEGIVEVEEAIASRIEAEEAGEGFSWWWLGFPWWLVLPWWLGFPWWWLLVFIMVGGLGCWLFDRSEPKHDTS